VPAGQRACPKCGGDRQCVEPHVTEVIELLPPEVIVRRDIYGAAQGDPPSVCVITKRVSLDLVSSR
jgi:hypothetical protein